MLLFITLAVSAYYTAAEEKSFLMWMREENQLFVGDEYQLRLGIYLQNLRLIKEHNRQSSFKLSANKFAALTPAEYKALLGHKSHGSLDERVNVKYDLKQPTDDTVDWRTKGVVNPIKDQGQCGSCWAFSVVQAQESQWAIATQTLLVLSEQNLVDCNEDCYGCGGGDEYISYDYVINSQDGKWMLEKDYPYKAVDQRCRWNATLGVSYTKAWWRPARKNETALAIAVATYGPISIAIDASQDSFQLYTSGVYDEPKCSPVNLDHAVGLVGYGTDGSKDYWIVRNSWGTSWGEKGYIRMSRNKNNQCGISTDVVLPIVQ